jgi:hypothetical protein
MDKKQMKKLRDLQKQQIKLLTDTVAGRISLHESIRKSAEFGKQIKELEKQLKGN